MFASQVVEKASNLLKGVLRLPWKSELTDGSKDLVAGGAALDEETREFLTPFLSQQPQQVSALGRANTQVARLRLSSLVWSPSGLSYAAWLCKLASGLCRLDESDAVWPLCEDMAELKPDFAELILPSLIFGVYLTAREDGETARLHEVGQAMKTALLTDTRADVKAVRMAINVLEFFRLFRLRVLHEHRGSRSTLGKEVLGWKTCFW